MKFTYKILTLLVFVTFLACQKDEVQVVHNEGVAPTLSSSSANVSLAAADSTSNVLSLNWTNPNYQVDQETTTFDVTYTLLVDLADNNFSSPIELILNNDLTKSYTGMELNRIMSNLSLEDTTQNYNMSAMVTSNLYVPSTSLTSNVVNFTVKPYSLKPSALYEVPDDLFLVGDATEGGWDNPVPEPSQKFTRLDEFTFGGIFNLGTGNYLMLPVNGDWGHKYALGSGDANGGDFMVDDGSDIPAPADPGNYKIVVDFVKGKYTVTPVAEVDLAPAALFMVGDATAGGWDNPVPVPSQEFTKSSSAGFEITVDLGAGNYLLLPENGSWDHKFAVADAGTPEAAISGPFVTDTGNDIPSQGPGTYHIFVEFVNRTYVVTKQ